MCDNFVSNRDKKLYTCCIYVSEITFGWFQGFIGPSLLDFQDRTGVSFSLTASYITTMDLGQIVGAFLMAFLHLRLNSFAIMFVISLFAAICVNLLPMCSIFTSFSIVITFIGLFIGLQTTLTVAELSAVWRDGGGSAMIGLFCVRKLGSITSASVMSQFLSSDIDNVSHRIADANTSTNYTSTNFQIPFEILGAFLVFTSIIFLVGLLLNRMGRVACLYSTEDMNKMKRLSMTYKRCICFLVFILYVVQNTISSGCIEFLSSFIVQQYTISRRTAAYISAMYMVCALLGRLLLLILRPYFQSDHLYLTNAVLVFLSALSMYVFTYIGLDVVSTCVFIGLIALTIHPNNSLLIVIVEESFFTVTAGIATVINIASLIGSMANSILKGFLMEKYGAVQFTLILLSSSVATLILSCVFLGLKRVLPNTNTIEEGEQLPLPLEVDLKSKGYTGI